MDESTVRIRECPNCDSRDITEQRRKGDWRCNNCITTFDSPDVTVAIQDPSLFVLPSGYDLRACREAVDMTIEELDELSGVSRTTISKWENEQSNPNLDGLTSVIETLRDKHGED